MVFFALRGTVASCGTMGVNTRIEVNLSLTAHHKLIRCLFKAQLLPKTNQSPQTKRTNKTNETNERKVGFKRTHQS